MGTLDKILNMKSEYEKAGIPSEQAISLASKNTGVNGFDIQNVTAKADSNSNKNGYKDVKAHPGSFVKLKNDDGHIYKVINYTNKDSILLQNMDTGEEIQKAESDTQSIYMESKMTKINEAQYNVSINGLETTDAETLSQMLSLAGQAENASNGVEDIPTTDAADFGSEEVPELNAYANPEMGDTAVVPTSALEPEVNSELPIEGDMESEMGMEEPEVDDMGDEEMVAPNAEDFDEMGAFDESADLIGESKCNEDVVLGKEFEDPTAIAQKREGASNPEDAMKELHMAIASGLKDGTLSDTEIPELARFYGVDEDVAMKEYESMSKGEHDIGAHEGEDEKVIVPEETVEEDCCGKKAVKESKEDESLSEEEIEEVKNYFKDIVADKEQYPEAEDMVEALRSLNTNGDITSEQYDYCQDHWDEWLNEFDPEDGAESVENEIDPTEEGEEAKKEAVSYKVYAIGADGSIEDKGTFETQEEAEAEANKITSSSDSDASVLGVDVSGEEFVLDSDEEGMEGIKEEPEAEEELLDDEVEDEELNVDSEMEECLRMAGIQLDESDRELKDQPVKPTEDTLYSNVDGETDYEEHKEEETFGKDSSEGTKYPENVKMESVVNVNKIKSICETAKRMYAKKEPSMWLALDRRYIDKLLREGVCYSNASKMLIECKKSK